MIVENGAFYVLFLSQILPRIFPFANVQVFQKKTDDDRPFPRVCLHIVDLRSWCNRFPAASDHFCSLVTFDQGVKVVKISPNARPAQRVK